MQLVHDADLRPLNTLGLPARARALARVRHWYELPPLLADPAVATLPCLVLGEGSNVVFRGDFDGLVVRIDNRGIRIVEEDARGEVLLRVAAGENWHGLVLWSVSRGLWGLENLALIPGTVGAAPVQNIGAYGVELVESFVSLRAFDRRQRAWVDLEAGDCAFGYRTSRFKDDPSQRYCITELLLRLSARGRPRLDYPGLADTVQAMDVPDPGPAEVAAAVAQLRRRKLPDPRLSPNVGSFFKNPLVSEAQAAELQGRHPDCPAHPAPGGRKLSAAWLIEAAGLKGARWGAVGVSERHALVLVNRGAATGRELWTAAERVQAAVEARFGIRLEPEPRIV